MTSSSSSLSLPDDSARPRRVPTAYGRSPFLPDGKCSMLTQESRKPLGVVGLDSDRDVDVCCLGRVCWNTVSSWSSVVVPFPDAFRFLFLLSGRITIWWGRALADVSSKTSRRSSRDRERLAYSNKSVTLLVNYLMVLPGTRCDLLAICGCNWRNSWNRGRITSGKRWSRWWWCD